MLSLHHRNTQTIYKTLYSEFQKKIKKNFANSFYFQKKFLYLHIIKNKTKTNIMKTLIASLKNLFSKKQVVNNTFDASQCKFDTIVENALKFDGRHFDAKFWATAKAVTIFYKEGYSFEHILGYSKVSKNDLTFMLMLTA